MQDFEEKLIQGKWLTSQNYSIAKKEAGRLGRSIWSTMVRLGFLSEEDISTFFAEESGIPHARLSDYEMEEGVVRLVSEEFCRKHSVIPVFRIQDTLFVAFSNPLDASCIDSLVKMTGLAVEPLITSKRAISTALDTHYGPDDNDFLIEQFLFRKNPLQGIPFKREAERINLEIPVSLKVVDSSVRLHYSSPIEGFTRNISVNGTALSLQVFLFLPRDIAVSLEFKPTQTLFSSGESIGAKGQIVYCQMEKGQRYLLGVRFTDIASESLNTLIRLARRK